MTKTKYILIDRGPLSPMATTPEVIKDWSNCIYEGKIVSQRPITMAEIRKDRIHVYTTEQHIVHLECERRREALVEWSKGVTHGTIDWFDRDRGDGMITCNGERLPIYACNIKGRKTWYPETACVYYEKGQVVECHIDIQGYGDIFCIGDTPGHFDAERWDQIRDTNLAFRCDDEGRVITGLMSEGESL